MVAVKTGFTPPPMPGMPAPMQPMGGMPPMPPMGGGALAPNPFAPMPPMPLAGMSPPPMRPPMAQRPMPQQIPQQQQISNAPRRKRFGDSLEGMLGRNMFAPQQRRPLPMPPQMMQQRMVAPGTPMMRTPTPRPMAMGGEVDIFGYEDGGPIQYMEEGGLKLGSGGFGGGSGTYGIEQARDSGGNLVPGMFVAKYADGTYSKPVTAANVEGLRQGLLSGNVTSGDYTASEASDMASKDLYLRSGDIAVTDRDVSGGFGGPLGMSNEMIGTDTVFVRFGDGTVVTAQKGMVDVLNEYGMLDNVNTRDDFSNVIKDLTAASSDPSSEAAKIMALFGEKQSAYNAALREDSNVQKNLNTFNAYYGAGDSGSSANDVTSDGTIPGSAAGPGTAVGAPANFGTGAYMPAPVDPSEVNPIDYTQFTGDVGNFSGTSESSALYGPKINIPQSVSQYYTSPVTGGLTTTYGPEMVATSPIGAIKLPARPVDIDIFDFLSTPTYGSLLVDEAEEMAMGGVVQGFANGGNANQQAAESMLAAGIGNVGGKAITSEAQDIQDRFSGLANRRSRRRRRRRERRAREEAARLAAEQAALAASSAAVPEAFTPSSGGIGAAPPGFGAAALPTGGPGTFPPAAPPPPSTDIIPEAFIPPSGGIDATPPGFGSTPPSTGIDATPPGFGSVPPASSQIDPINLSQNIVPKDDSFAESMFIDETNPYAVGGGLDVTAPAEPQNYESTASQMIMNQADMTLGPGNLNDPRGNQIVSPTGTGIGIPPVNISGSDKDDKSNRLTPEELESLKASLGEQVPISGIEKVINQIIGKTFFGLGSGFADKLRNSSEAERRAIVDQHLNALNSGATPVYNDKGEYIGFNMNTMDTFADKVLAADDIMAFMPPSFGTFKNPAYQVDADGDGVPDFERFQQIMNAQSEAAKNDPFGQSTEQGFITSDGKEFFVDAGGNVVEVKDSVVPFEIGGGDSAIDIFSTTTKDDGGDSGSDTTGDVDLGHTIDEDGNIVCNTPGYIYNPETKICELPKEEDTGSDSPKINIGRAPVESFDDVLARITTAAPNIAPISANVRPMQEGGMAGLNRAADNFLKALAG